MLTGLKKTPNLQVLARLFSDTSLTKKAYLNALVAALEYAARLVVGFVLTPLLVAGLGDSLFGIWKILTSVTGYLTAASGRPTQTLKFTLASIQSSTDYDEKRRQVGSALAVWLLFCPLLLTLGGLMVWLLPIWLDLPAEVVWPVRVATSVLVLQMTLLSLADIPQAIMEGENIGYKRMGLSALLVVIGGGFSALAIYLQWGIIGVAAASLLSTLLMGALYLQVTHSHIHWLGIARPSGHALGRFIGLSWWFLLWRLVMQLMLASDIFLLGLFASVDLVTNYSLTKYLPETLVSLIAMVVFGIAPGLGGIIGAGDLKKAAHIRGEIQLFTWFVATVIGTVTLLWNADFLALWVGEGYHVGVDENFLLIVMIFQFVMIRNDGNFIDLTLEPAKKVILGMLAAAISTGAAMLGIQYFPSAIAGLCLGIIAGRLLLSVGYPMLIGRYLQITLWQQCRAAIRPCLITGALFLFSVRPTWLVPVWITFGATSWFELIVGVNMSLVIVMGLVFYGGMTAKQRTQIISRLRRVLVLPDKRH